MLLYSITSSITHSVRHSQFAQKVKQLGWKAKIVAVNCVTDGSICTEIPVRGYPTVINYFKHTQNEQLDGAGGKETQDLIEYLKPFVIIDANEEIPEEVTTMKSMLRNDNSGETSGSSMEMYVTIEDTVLRSKVHDMIKAAKYSVEYSLLAYGQADFLPNLIEWLTVLSKNLPTNTARGVFGNLLKHIVEREDREVITLNQWYTILEDFKITDSKSVSDFYFCKSYTCALWLVFHTITVASGRGGEVQTPSKSAIAIRSYVETFFGCMECRTHFLAANPPEKLVTLGDDADSVTLWLWEMHNSVSLRLKQPQFPSKYMCPTCYLPSSGDVVRWNTTETLSFLQTYYCAGGREVVESECFTNEIEPSRLDFWIPVVVVIIGVAVVIIAFLYKNSTNFRRVLVSANSKTHSV